MNHSFQTQYIEILTIAWNQRKEINPSFSLRSLAKFLDTSPGALSQILKAKRPLTFENGLKWAQKLNLENENKKNFLEALQNYEHSRTNETEKDARKLEAKFDFYQLKLDNFAIIRDWYHFAILNLTLLDSFKSNTKWISKSLGITIEETNAAITRLKRLGLLAEIDGILVRTAQNIETPTDIPSEDIRSFHKQNINRALKAIDDVDVNERDISSIMMPIDEKKLDEAKKKIRNFRKDLSAFLKADDEIVKTEKVYSLNIQLFPQNKDVGEACD